MDALLGKMNGWRAGGEGMEYRKEEQLPFGISNFSYI